MSSIGKILRERMFSSPSSIKGRIFLQLGFTENRINEYYRRMNSPAINWETIQQIIARKCKERMYEI